ncbi:hypothetical protein [Caldilinea sp.]|uniref:hypothetical protein n=1 Tax=Caldilinea sp. TaxID=2293560 RepID=UPI002C08C483|nr:GreA/GreB family elongation factor [Anaerolineales bacterium]HQY91892.1 hypothetical protein [Caldilinea sp.]HRA66347.1 hypothetical protein [Caldilinea sp.]
MMQENLQVRVGRRVQVVLIHQDAHEETLTLDIVPDAAANFEQGLLGESTRLAQALIGQRTGGVVDYGVGDLRQVCVLAVTRSPQDLDHSAGERRQEILDKAVSESDRTNALNFAASFASKWGSYDPAGIEEWEQADE